MNQVPVYSYDPVTFLFVGFSDADESPLEPNEFLYPANSTVTPPPESETQWALYHADTDSWTLVDPWEPETPIDPGTHEPSTDPADYPLSARQIRLGLVRHGVPLSAVSAAIASIPDEEARDEAQIYWDFSTQINWDHAMTQALMALAGFDQPTASAMWMAAKDYER